MVQVWLRLVKNQGHFIWLAVCLPGCISASTASLQHYKPDNVEFDSDTGNGSGYSPYTSVSPTNHNFTKFQSWFKLKIFVTSLSTNLNFLIQKLNTKSKLYNSLISILYSLQTRLSDVNVRKKEITEGKPVITLFPYRKPVREIWTTVESFIVHTGNTYVHSRI